MLLGEVHVPAEVLSAWEEGRLVIFTGAGISMDPPSNLPNFAGLASEVARIVQSPLDPYSDEWGDQLDTFMDTLDESDDVDVHRLVHGIITPAGSQPNANHEALAQIAAKFSSPVITTNYDQHLETALRAVLPSDVAETLQVFRAPAMPLGNDFDGLVYLHGSVADDPRRLVVTDRDFSHAYFHEAWATRFLERMFRHYVVLFVGYSHSDVVMKYLGLGLGPTSKRYVLTDQPDLSTWKRLHVLPLAYPRGRHDLLTGCLAAWAAHGDRGLLEHRQRIRELVSTASAPTPEELSYLEESIQRADRVSFFCEIATDNFWLDWASEQPVFARLFDPGASREDVTDALALWFARRFAVVGDVDGVDVEPPSLAAWRAFARLGGMLSTTTWNAIAQSVLAFDGTRPNHVLRWLWVLMDQERAGCTFDLLDLAVEYDEVQADQTLLLALLRHLMTPSLVAERGYWGPDQMGVRTRGDRHWLEEAWKKLSPHMAEDAVRVLPVVEAVLRSHLDLEARAASSAIGYTRRRSAIQPHAQDRHREPIDIIIDAVRDAAVALWPSQSRYLETILERWLSSEHMLMRRIAVHVAGEKPGATGSDHVRFILDNGLATERGLAQEVLHLLMRAAPTAESDLVDRLVDEWMPAGDEEREWYRSFSRLETLERAGVANARLDEALARVRSRLPDDLEGSPYPGMASWSESGSAVGEQPMTVASFDQMIREGPGDAANFILSFEERTFPRSGETAREDALQLLRETVVERPAAGLELWPHIDQHPDLQGTVVAAWGEVKGSEDLDAIMAVLVEAALLPTRGGLGQFLMHAERRDSAPWETVAATPLFIERAWAAAATEETYEPGRDSNQHWVSKGYNELAGVLTEFWFELFRRRWSAAGDDWRGLTEEDKRFLERALRDRTERGALAQTLIAGRIHFLDAADTTWCTTTLLPLLAWSEPALSEPIWWGVLTFARWNERLAANGMLTGLLDVTAHLDAFDDNAARRWASLLASIAVRSEITPASSWIDTLTAKATQAQRVAWIEAVEDDLAETDVAMRAPVWQRWLADYWRRRTVGLPAVLAQREADALSVLACHLAAEQFEEAVTLVEATSAAFDSHGEAAHRLPDDLIDAAPGAAGRFLTHLMINTQNNSQRPFWGNYHLRPKLLRVLAHPGEWRALREAALRLGIALP